MPLIHNQLPKACLNKFTLSQVKHPRKMLRPSSPTTLDSLLCLWSEEMDIVGIYPQINFFADRDVKPLR